MTRTISVITRHVLEYEGEQPTSDDIARMWFYNDRDNHHDVDFRGESIHHVGCVVVSVNETPKRHAA